MEFFVNFASLFVYSISTNKQVWFVEWTFWSSSKIYLLIQINLLLFLSKYVVDRLDSSVYLDCVINQVLLYQSSERDEMRPLDVSHGVSLIKKFPRPWFDFYDFLVQSSQFVLIRCRLNQLIDIWYFIQST
jgi:hypothetical protein